ncbi:hypothetical protein GCM10010211_75120 [Streptomyces albospinus]|uniref:Transposase n=1 Tax=Streptomyces albospinus TaxID=285515 RepID=A0ABQ2VNQ0_9ACTN|nr:hypothetical protein GCM10010211_75120 [Streptomyces albospinus]
MHEAEEPSAEDFDAVGVGSGGGSEIAQSRLRRRETFPVRAVDEPPADGCLGGVPVTRSTVADDHRCRYERADLPAQEFERVPSVHREAASALSLRSRATMHSMWRTIVEAVGELRGAVLLGRRRRCSRGRSEWSSKGCPVNDLRDSPWGSGRRARPDHLRGDKGYISRRNRQHPRRRQIRHTIREHKDQQGVNALKSCRAMATRYGKRAHVVHGTVTLAAIRMRLR